MPITVIETTDGKYVGRTIDVDPRNLPHAISTVDGAVFHPIGCDEIAPGKWRLWNYNYIVIAIEV